MKSKRIKKHPKVHSIEYNIQMMNIVFNSKSTSCRYCKFCRGLYWILFEYYYLWTFLQNLSVYVLFVEGYGLMVNFNIIFRVRYDFAHCSVISFHYHFYLLRPADLFITCYPGEEKIVNITARRPRRLHHKRDLPTPHKCGDTSWHWVANLSYSLIMFSKRLSPTIFRRYR